MNSISAQTLGSLSQHESHIILVDVRSPAEYEREHAAGAHSLPLIEIDAGKVRNLIRSSEDRVYVLCERGYRARLAIQKLEGDGFEGAVHVEGGTDAWATAGLPLIRGPRTARLSNRSALAIEFVLVALAAVLGSNVHVAFLLMFLGLATGFAAFHEWRLKGWQQTVQARKAKG